LPEPLAHIDAAVWIVRTSYKGDFRCAYRGGDYPDRRDYDIGFRVVRR
jgi:formylglycine-generating enzyme required for sulfatase activity